MGTLGTLNHTEGKASTQTFYGVTKRNGLAEFLPSYHNGAIKGPIGPFFHSGRSSTTIDQGERGRVKLKSQNAIYPEVVRVIATQPDNIEPNLDY
jgi:hypothetical protein